MKKLLLLLLTLSVLYSCSKDDNYKDGLPAETQIGKGTAGCLVNGNVFIPKGNNQFGPTLSCFYQRDQYGFHLGLSISAKGKGETKSVNVATNSEALVENSTYELVAITTDAINNQYNSNFGEFIIASAYVQTTYFYTTNLSKGELKITKLDTLQNIISGTFWFDAVNSSGEKTEVRQGRFDMRYN